MCGETKLTNYKYLYNIHLHITYRQLHDVFKGLDKILNLLRSSNIEFIICGDININYLVDNCKKKTTIRYPASFL
jgi:hypothetical protein